MKKADVTMLPDAAPTPLDPAVARIVERFGLSTENARRVLDAAANDTELADQVLDTCKRRGNLDPDVVCVLIAGQRHSESTRALTGAQTWHCETCGRELARIDLKAGSRAQVICPSCRHANTLIV